MLDGITVLHEEQIMKSPTWAFIVCLCAIIGAIIFTICYIYSEKYSKTETITSLAIICCLGLFLSSLICYGILKEPTGEYEYQVTISPSVSLTEFHSNYEVISIEGDIYTIKIKEVDND